MMNLNLKLKQLLIRLLFIIVILSCFLSGSGSTRRSKEQITPNYTAQKVRLIMKLYQCNDEEIFRAIMDTFDPVLVASVIAIESGFKKNVISRKGARGLMQLTPDKLDDWKDVKKNIQVGAAYLKEQIARFKDVDLAIAAYNAGPTSVVRHGGIPPYQETRKYVQKIKVITMALNNYFIINHLTSL
ncbi:MAG TPA: lytic transglycosylase domain-containing protein [Bacillota bacterium]|nr:lytic transglycosylase domain-containing protein [Bacillota bacterium]HPO97694.1 lytic transglycosylase domain-containing protein [Bacillota bacterium]